MKEESPFFGTEIKPNVQESGALIEVEQQRAIAETQAAMIIAKRFRRNQADSMDKILTACTRIGLAESALYQYSRGGTDITGPSIRLAEAIAQNWENLQFGIRELEQKNGWSTVEAFAWDVESNVRQVKIFQVPHKRHTKKGTYALEDPRDIYEMIANQGARRLRACVLGLIPGDVIEAAVKQCETTLKTKAEVTPERIASVLEKFDEIGVTKGMIEKRIQRHIDALTPALMVNLGKIYNSLKDGMSMPADWFEIEAQTPQQTDVPKTASEALKEKLSAGQPEQTPPPPPKPEAPPWARESWIRLKGPGYPSYVLSNKDTFLAAPKAIREEAIGKWKSMFPMEPWPIHEPKENPVEPPPKKEMTLDEKTFVLCMEMIESEQEHHPELVKKAMENTGIQAVETIQQAEALKAEILRLKEGKEERF